MQVFRVSYGGRKLLRRLPSRQMVLRFVHDALVPRAEGNQALIIVTRAVKAWGLQETDNIIVYRGSESRSASLSPKKSRGGRTIVENLGLQIS